MATSSSRKLIADCFFKLSKSAQFAAGSTLAQAGGQFHDYSWPLLATLLERRLRDGRLNFGAQGAACPRKGPSPPDQLAQSLSGLSDPPLPESSGQRALSQGGSLCLSDIYLSAQISISSSTRRKTCFARCGVATSPRLRS